MFAEVARNLAGRDENHPFSRHFVSNFVLRHKSELVLDGGKITSPTRKLEAMFELTQEFIVNFNMLLATGKANEKKHIRF